MLLTFVGKKESEMLGVVKINLEVRPVNARHLCSLNIAAHNALLHFIMDLLLANIPRTNNISEIKNGNVYFVYTGFARVKQLLLS